MQIEPPAPSSAGAWAKAPTATQKRRSPALAIVGVGVAITLAVMAAVSLVLLNLEPANERPELAGAVYVAASKAGDGGTVDFRSIATFEWDRMYEFAAYTPDSEVSQVLGFAWGNDDPSRLPSESFVLLIFAKGNQVTGWVVLNDYQSTGPLVQFDGALDEKPIVRDAAVFRASLEANSTTGGHDIYTLAAIK